MDPRYPTQEGRTYGSSRAGRSRQENEEEPWDAEDDEEYQDLNAYYQISRYDPQLQNNHTGPRETILPPGTSIASYSGYRQPAYTNYGASPPPTHSQQMPIYGDYQYGHRNPTGLYPYVLGEDPRPSIVNPDPQRQRPVKRFNCEVEGCNRSVPGNGFTTLNDLERHGRSKHGDDGQYIECRYEGCPDIGKRFPRRDNFIDHFCRVHGGNLAKEAVKALASDYAKQWMVVKKAGNWDNR